MVDASVVAGFVSGNFTTVNLGGGGFILIYDKDTDKISSIDYRSAAPKNATSEMYVDGVASFRSLSQCSPSSAVGLLKAHEDFGSLPLRILLQPPGSYEDGFQVTYDLNYV